MARYRNFYKFEQVPKAASALTAAKQRAPIKRSHRSRLRLIQLARHGVKQHQRQAENVVSRDPSRDTKRSIVRHGFVLLGQCLVIVPLFWIPSVLLGLGMVSLQMALLAFLYRGAGLKEQWISLTGLVLLSVIGLDFLSRASKNAEFIATLDFLPLVIAPIVLLIDGIWQLGVLPVSRKQRRIVRHVSVLRGLECILADSYRAPGIPAIFIDAKGAIRAKPDFLFRDESGNLTVVEYKSRASGKIFPTDERQALATALCVKAWRSRVHQVIVATDRSYKVIDVRDYSVRKLRQLVIEGLGGS